MNGRESYTIPSTEFDEIPDRIYSDLKHVQHYITWGKHTHLHQASQDILRKIRYDLWALVRSELPLRKQIHLENAAGHTSQIVRILSILRHLNRGHIVKFMSTSPRPKSKPPGNRAITSRLASTSFLGLASSLIRSPALGAGWASILEI